MIYDNIRRRCNENHIALSTLEKKVGLANGAISYWKNGNPRVDLLKRVADYFGCTIDDLMREGEK